MGHVFIKKITRAIIWPLGKGERQEDQWEGSRVNLATDLTCGEEEVGEEAES